MTDPKVPRCPTTPDPEGDEATSGCGSTKVSEPDEEGFRDCYDCGLFFKDGGGDSPPPPEPQPPSIASARIRGMWQEAAQGAIKHSNLLESYGHEILRISIEPDRGGWKYTIQHQPKGN